MNIIKWLFFTVLVSVFYTNVSFSMDVEKIELVADTGADRVTVLMKRGVACQSGMIKDMLEECYDDEDEEIPSIPVPNVRPRDLRGVKTLFEQAKKLKNKKELVDFIENKIKNDERPLKRRKKTTNVIRKKENFEKDSWGNLEKQMHLLKAADYLNAGLVVRALAYVLSEKQITKDDLKKFPSNIFYQILVHHILRINSCYSHEILKIFDREIIDDLKKTKPIIEKDKNLDNIKNLYDQVLEGLKNGKIFMPLYNIYEEGVEKLVDYSLGEYIDGFTFPLLASAGACDSTVTLWDAETGEVKKTLTGHVNNVSSLVVSPDGNLLVSGSWDDTIKLWDVSNQEDPKLIKTLSQHSNWVRSIVFSPDGKILASGSADNTIKLWNLSDPKSPVFIGTLNGHENWVNSLSFSPDGRILISGAYDNAIKLWDLSDTQKPTPITTLYEIYPIYSVVFSPDGKIFASASDDNKIKLWNISNPKTPKLITILGDHTGAVKSIAFSPNGNFLASASDDCTINLWNVSSPQISILVTVLDGHSNSVRSVMFSQNGNLLVSGSADKTIKLWDVSIVQRPKLLKTLKGRLWDIDSVVFRPVNLKEK